MPETERVPDRLEGQARGRWPLDLVLAGVLGLALWWVTAPNAVDSGAVRPQRTPLAATVATGGEPDHKQLCIETYGVPKSLCDNVATADEGISIPLE